MQCAAVNKCISSVGGITDAENVVIFGRTGGMVIPEKDVKIIVKDHSRLTNFRRHGMVYRMDAWVKAADVRAKNEGFQKHGRA